MINLQRSEIPLVLFAKTPVHGKVKTRLQPECSEKQCLEVAKILLEESIIKAVNGWDGKLILSVWPDMDDNFIKQMSQQYPIELSMQSKGDLGDKMSAAFSELGYPMAIMGCDAPHITESTLVDCYTHLAENNSCIGESMDGGYYIVGLNTPCHEIFKGIEWGSESVFTSTMQISERQLLKFKQLPILNDIDTWQDLIEASAQLPTIYNYLSEQKLI